MQLVWINKINGKYHGYEKYWNYTMILFKIVFGNGSNRIPKRKRRTSNPSKLIVFKWSKQILYFKKQKIIVQYEIYILKDTILEFFIDFIYFFNPLNPTFLFIFRFVIENFQSKVLNEYQLQKFNVEKKNETVFIFTAF